MRPAPESLVLLVGLVLAGCSVGPGAQGHREFSRGDFAAAQSSYEAVLERGDGDSEVFLRLAVAYLVAEPEDPRAEELLRRVATEDVGGPQRPVATLLLALRRNLLESQRETDAVRLRVSALESELEERSELIDGLRGEGKDTDRAIGQLERSRAQLKRELADARKLLEAETAKVKALRAELQKLKDIDLGRPPGRK